MGEHQEVLGLSAMLETQNNILKENNGKEFLYDNQPPAQAGNLFFKMSGVGAPTPWHLLEPSHSTD